MIRKIVIPTLILIAVFASLTIKELSKKEISYKEMPVENTFKTLARNSAAPHCGITRLNGNKYQASIIPGEGEKIEIISVQKSDNVGIDVIYKIHKLPDNNANPEGKSVVFRNIFDSPVGFVLSY